MTRASRHAGRRCRLPGFDLVAHGLDRLWGAGGHDAAGLGQGTREGVPFGTEAIARMTGLSTCLLAGPYDLLDDEIGLGRRGRANGNLLIRHFGMKRRGVSIVINSDGPAAHAACRLDDPTGNLAPVGNQDLLEHSSSHSPILIASWEV